ncbi:MAG: InlB B-repeat-containing protein, partial [Clostridia bacterium]|nr:InlB B-repeat-containing protein [Clostridia bacterium]
PNSSLSADEITSLKNTYALCTVHYMDQSGTELKNEMLVYGSKITPPEYTAADGNTFYGWFNKNGNIQWDVANDGVKADVWLYAKEGNPYTVSKRQDIDLQLNDDGSVNTSKTVTLDLTEIGENVTVTSVKYNGAEIATSATFNVSVFGQDYGEKDLFVAVEKDGETLNYTVPVTLISRVISDRTEFLKWPTIAKACETDASLWGGYFTLDADINVNCAAGWTGTSGLLIDMGSGDGSTSGFKGTWDGRGYAIKSMWLAPGANKAFVSGLHKDGVIKNIAFTDAAVGNGAYVVAWGQGTVENVLVQYSYYGMRAIASNTAYATAYESGTTATFYGVVGNSGLHRNIVNCVIDFSNEAVFTAQSSSNGSHVIGKVYDYADFQGVHLIGAKSWMNIVQHWDTKGNYYQVKAGDTLPAGEVYLYDTVTAWESAANNECLYNWYQIQLDKLGATKLENSSTGVETVKVLKAQTADLGLSVVDGALVGMDEIVINLSEIGNYAGTLFSAKFDGTTLSGAYIDGNRLVVPATAFAQTGGEGTLNLMTTLGNYEMPLIVASKVIYTVDDYNAFGDVAKLLGAAKGDLIWDGYFALGANLSQDGGIVLNEFIDRSKVTLVRDGTDGFAGTFNGCGYAIDGLIRTVNTSNAFITALHSDGVLKNIAFTNVTFASASGSFLCGGGKGLIQNVYVQYNEISNANSSGYSGTVYSGNTSVVSLFVDASACTMSGNGTSFRLIGLVTAKGQSYCLYPSNYTATQAREGSLNSSTVQAFASAADMLADTTAQAKIAAWDSEYWTVVNGVPVFNNVKENGAAYLNVTLGETTAIDLELSVNDSGALVYSNSSVTVDLSDYGTDLGKVISATYNGNNISVSVRNGVVSIPVAQFGSSYSTATDTIVIKTTKGTFTLPVYLYSMVIETVEEYQTWTDVAYALGYDNGGYHYWDGAFALGANLSADGGIALNEGITRDLVGSASGSAGGFVGIFDGCGYTIDGLIKNGNVRSGFIGIGAGGTLKNIALTNVVWNGTQGGLISFAGKGTYEDIYVSYASVSNATGTYVGTFDVGNAASTKKRIFIDASNTVWDDASKSNFKLVGQGNFYGGLFGVDNRLTTDSYTTTSFSGTMGSGWAELIRFQSKAQMGMFATYYNNSASSYSKAINTWLTTCEYWSVVNGIPMMGGKTYTVTFENADGSVLSTQTVARGDMPVAPQSPTFDSDDSYVSYTFIGWDKEIVAVSGNVTYTAVYVPMSSHTHNYTVSYTDNGDGTHSAYCECGDFVTEGHSYDWEAQADKNVQICTVCGSEGESVLTQLSAPQDINLALTISDGALATKNNAVSLNLAEASALPLTTNSVTYNGTEVTSTATFGHDFGEKSVVVKAATEDGYVHTINVPVLLISKVITTRADFCSTDADSFDKIAKLLGEEYNAVGGANIWDGYFVLG